MSILLKEKPEIDALLGRPTTAPVLMEMCGPPHGERAWEYRVGAYRIVVGYLDGVARYLTARKAAGGALSTGDVLSVLSAELGGGTWTIEPPFEESKPAPKTTTKTQRTRRTPEARVRYYRAQRKDARGADVQANYLGWTRAAKATLFLCTPYTKGRAPLFVDEAAIEGKLM